MRKRNKGFTLVELIVVIAIMMVMLAVLAPALMSYVENTRSDKDNSQMDELMTAIEMGMTDQNIYEDLLMYALESNYSCYADGNPATNTAINRIEDFNVGGNAEGVVGAEDLWSYGDDARELTKTQYIPSGNMCGVTITFVHNYDGETKDFDIGNALINNMASSYKKSNTTKLGEMSTDGTTYLYNYLKRVVSETITTESSKYCNSEYTIFIRMLPANADYDKYEAMPIEIYGQWNGVNLKKDMRRDALDEVNGIDAIEPGSMPDVIPAPIPVAPNAVGSTPQTPKDVASFVSPKIKENLVYNENAQELILAGSSDEGTMYYKLKNGDWSVNVPRATDAGQYEVFYYVKGDSEHYNTQEYSLKVNIQKATPQYTIPTGKNNLYANGTTQQLITAGHVSKGGTMLYKLSSTGYSTTIPTGKAPAIYTVLWKIQETDNYNEYPETVIEVTIGKMNPNPVAPTPNDLTYTGARQQLALPATIGNTGMPDNLPVIEYSLDGQAWSTQVPYGLNAGSYKVYYRVNENAYYKGTAGTDFVNCEIKKAAPNVDIQWNDQLTYTANTNQKFIDDIKKDSPETVNIRMTYKGTTTPYGVESPQGMSAGDYVIEWYIPENPNYNGSGTEAKPNKKTISINKAYATDINKITVSGATWVYDKTEHRATVGNGDGWTISYTLDGQNATPAVTNSGTYTYQWTATHENFQTEIGEVTLECQKAPVRILVAPKGDSKTGSATRIRYMVQSTGQLVNIEYTPPSVSLSAVMTQGTCTEGGTIVYTGDRNLTKTFQSENGTAMETVTCDWELVPESDNYYVEGAASGAVSLTLTFTLKEQIVYVSES